MVWLIYVALGCFGLAVGSFLNVVIYRVPAGESVVSPASACPECGTQIRARDNIPLFSWLFLRGKCRNCAAPISVRYALVEVLNALLWALCYLHFRWSIELLVFIFLSSVGLALTSIDFATHRLPNALVLPSYVVIGGLFLVGALIGEPWGGDWSQLLRALLGGISLYGFYFLLVMIYPRGMGFGDVKLAGVLGAALGWFGWGSLAVGSFAAFLLGGILSMGLLITGRARRGSGIPFGPWMILGAGIGVVWGEGIFSAYVRLIGF